MADNQKLHEKFETQNKATHFSSDSIFCCCWDCMAACAAAWNPLLPPTMGAAARPDITSSWSDIYIQSTQKDKSYRYISTVERTRLSCRKKARVSRTSNIEYSDNKLVDVELM